LMYAAVVHRVLRRRRSQFGKGSGFERRDLTN
jgi:hypothetical protein